MCAFLTTTWKARTTTFITVRLILPSGRIKLQRCVFTDVEVCDGYLAGGHCHRFRSAALSCRSPPSEITAHLSKSARWWCCENSPPATNPPTHRPTRFTCWPSNQIQPRRGPHLGPASSAPVSSDSPPQSASITG